MQVEQITLLSSFIYFEDKNEMRRKGASVYLSLEASDILASKSIVQTLNEGRHKIVLAFQQETSDG
jgi:predicted TIM-barrel fold metal-dependent hydrolase